MDKINFEKFQTQVTHLLQLCKKLQQENRDLRDVCIQLRKNNEQASSKISHVMHDLENYLDISLTENQPLEEPNE